jgi:hypothetical protein
MTLLLRLAALFFRALSAFDRWLADADPGEDRDCDACDVDRIFHALTDPLEAEIDGRKR